MSKKSEEKIIKETKYCKIINQGKVGEGEYTYSIEKIYIKELKRYEVRFCVYKATRRGDETYIPKKSWCNGARTNRANKRVNKRESIFRRIHWNVKTRNK